MPPRCGACLLYTSGSNLLTVNITSSRYLPLSLQDVENIAAENENISATAAKISQSSTVKAGSTTYSASIIGNVPASQDLSALTLARGRFLKTPDLDNNSACLLYTSKSPGQRLYAFVPGRLTGMGND